MHESPEGTKCSEILDLGGRLGARDATSLFWDWVPLIDFFAARSEWDRGGLTSGFHCSRVVHVPVSLQLLWAGWSGPVVVSVW